jgi:hypothetical protein
MPRFMSGSMNPNTPQVLLSQMRTMGGYIVKRSTPMASPQIPKPQNIAFPAQVAKAQYTASRMLDAVKQAIPGNTRIIQ